MFEDFVEFIRNVYATDEFIPLHAPVFTGNEKQYLLDTIDSGFVSSVGTQVVSFEENIAEYTGAAHAVATVNGASALHIALMLANVQPGDEVITQSVSFVATCNAISYCGAHPVFVDISRKTLSLSAAHLQDFLKANCEIRKGQAINRLTGKKIAACVPMHTFGHCADMPEITRVCDSYNIPVVEDAAESLGSQLGDAHCGTMGMVGVLSFNGNKIITTGGGGMILTQDENLAARARHLTTTAKMPHRWEYEHDEIGYNYRMPNLNAALGLAQLEQLELFINIKRDIAEKVSHWSTQAGVGFVSERAGSSSNYWLNTLVMNSREQRNEFLDYTNNHGVMTRPLWKPMHRLKMYSKSQCGSLDNTQWAEERLINVPSGVMQKLQENQIDG